jgi:putative ABC transport system permease protein
MVFALSLKIFWRELKSGYLNSSLFSLILAVTIVSGISLFTDRLEKALSLESAEFLGGDLKFESNESPKAEIYEKARELNLLYSQQVLFASVVYSKTDLQLSSIKTVDGLYPLVGEIELENELGKFLVSEPPKKGEVWLDERLKNILDIDYGETLGIGDKDFIFSNSIVYEPDRSSSSFAFAPKAMINELNLKETNVIQPGSRIRYSALFSGDENSLSLMNEYLLSIKMAGDEITTVGDDTSSLGRAIDRSGNFFLLAGLIAVILSAFTVGISSQRFSRRHTNYVAILKTLGMNSSSLKLFYFQLFLYMALLSLVVGLLLGWLIQLNFVELLSTYFPTKLPSPGLEPFFISSATVVICLIGFVYPHILRLLKITPLTIIRKEDHAL